MISLDVGEQLLGEGQARNHPLALEDRPARRAPPII
jgi:hypothetical protein